MFCLFLFVKYFLMYDFMNPAHANRASEIVNYFNIPGRVLFPILRDFQ